MKENAIDRGKSNSSHPHRPFSWDLGHLIIPPEKTTTHFIPYSLNRPPKKRFKAPANSQGPRLGVGTSSAALKVLEEALKRFKPPVH
jgi:hypothetical protein